jgi:4-hydroxybenzoate polyprenyltransferase
MDKIFPEKIHNYFELIRLNKPIGFMLLLWPCWFSLAYLEFPQQYLLSYYILFFIGSVIMRSAGCIINDLVDQDIDSKIERTATRPLASKKITNLNAIIFLSMLLAIGLLILLQFKTSIYFSRIVMHSFNYTLSIDETYNFLATIISWYYI